MAKIIKGDLVKVLSGNYKGEIGKVLFMKGEQKCVVEGVNVRKKAVKRQSEEDTGFTEILAPIDISNVALCVESDNKKIAVKLKKRLSAGKKELYYKLGSSEFVHRVISTFK